MGCLTWTALALIAVAVTHAALASAAAWATVGGAIGAIGLAYGVVLAWEALEKRGKSGDD